MQRRTNSITLRGRTTWVRELIHAAYVTVFFLDEDQRVTLADIGTRDEIVLWAEELGADIEELELLSQFRCNGSDGYLAWVDHVLGIRETHARRLLLALEE